jgi:UDP:flavonoid glycosyltransferase YjiC (YdhE family)
VSEVCGSVRAGESDHGHSAGFVGRRGAVPPLLGLGAELVLRGHAVRCLHPSIQRAAFERVGIAFRALQHDAGYDALERLTAAEERRRVVEVFSGVGYAHDLRAEVARVRPDVVVLTPALISAQAAAESLGVPRVFLLSTLAGAAAAGLMRRIDALNAVRTREGLPPVASGHATLATASAVIVASTPSLDSLPTVFPVVHHVGPIFGPEDAMMGISPMPEVPDGTAPLVLVGFSSTYMEGQESTLGRLISALRDLPVRAVLTTGPGVDSAALPDAANVSALSWLPHDLVLPHAALMVTHAGHGSVIRALTHGVPLLCLPLGRDQPFVAGRVAAVGGGLTVPPESGPEALISALTTLLGDDGYRERARRMADEIAALGPGAVNGADVVEAIVGRRG